MNRHSASGDGLLDVCVTNIDRFNPVLNSVIHDMRDDATEQRKVADGRDPGRWLGLLANVPVSIKDAFGVHGTPTSNGTAYYRDTIAAEDAPLVHAIRRAGGLIHAKDSLSELSCGATNQNETFGDCLNPWDLERIPGGSSGGSAVSVAAGMSVIAFGTDAGGSVRIPASINGVAALRPTTGRLPNNRGPGVPQPMPDFSTPGPIARRVTDIARSIAAVDMHVPSDPTSLPHDRDNVIHGLGRDVRGLRIGMATSYFFDTCDPGIAEAVSEALSLLESLGAVLIDLPLTQADRAHQTQTTMMLAQYVSATDGRFAEAPHTFGSEVRRRLQIGAETSAVDYVDALRWRQDWKRTLDRAFATVDVIASPTVPVAPPETQSADMVDATRAVSRNTYAWSLADVPALTIPCGLVHGFPAGLQLVAAPWQEATLITAGDAFQSATDWHLTLPPVGADPYVSQGDA